MKLSKPISCVLIVLLSVFLFLVLFLVILIYSDLHVTKYDLSKIPGINQKILKGAKEEIKNKTRYNREMNTEVFPLLYSNGRKMNHSVYPNGDVNPNEGVCTDLVIRALRNGGFDLQKEIHEDVIKNKNYYGINHPDKSIDHRRTWVLLKYFKKHFRQLPTKETTDYSNWLPGDIVIWDTGVGKPSHIGILSDKRIGKYGRPLVIHNMPFVLGLFPGRVCEQDALFGLRNIGSKLLKFRLIKKLYYRVPLIKKLIKKGHWEVLGHFRLSEKK
ncbi:MAG: DUF1287 domain-containing protein [Calditrichaeota bacterium]|nr:DUF1287 domain-containing protein [Calditrichota bacterium]